MGLFFLLWIGGMAAFWIGALLAQVNGYPIRVPASLGAAALIAAGQLLLIRRLSWGQELIGGLVLGIIPAYLGFYLQSRHWVSELFILGFLLSLASLNALLALRWRREWQYLEPGRQDQHVGRARRGLVFTLVNILIIGGLLLIWYFPASPLPGRWGAWVLIGVAVMNQEFMKRKYYRSKRGSAILAWSATVFGAGLSLWLLLVFYWRGQG